MNKFDRNVALYDVIYVLEINRGPIILLHCACEMFWRMFVNDGNYKRRPQRGGRRRGETCFVDFPIFMPLSGRVEVF